MYRGLPEYYVDTHSAVLNFAYTRKCCRQVMRVQVHLVYLKPH